MVFCIGVVVQTVCLAVGGSSSDMQLRLTLGSYQDGIHLGREVRYRSRSTSSDTVAAYSTLTPSSQVGSLSMAVPLYNAELAPPEVRGSLVALQQLAITFGICISFWIDYGQCIHHFGTCSIV